MNIYITDPIHDLPLSKAKNSGKENAIRIYFFVPFTSKKATINTNGRISEGC